MYSKNNLDYCKFLNFEISERHTFSFVPSFLKRWNKLIKVYNFS